MTVGGVFSDIIAVQACDVIFCMLENQIIGYFSRLFDAFLFSASERLSSPTQK
jgi:hypothetical protein